MKEELLKQSEEVGDWKAPVACRKKPYKAGKAILEKLFMGWSLGWAKSTHENDSPGLSQSKSRD